MDDLIQSNGFSTEVSPFENEETKPKDELKSLIFFIFFDTTPKETITSMR